MSRFTKEPRSHGGVPIRYEHPQAWVQRIPDHLLDGNRHRDRMLSPYASRGLCDWLETRGLPRPTLLQLESERVRRGIRRPRQHH